MSILISLAAEFTGKKAFKDADKNVSALEKGVKKLGKALAGAFAVEKVVAFGKASAQAFIKDQAEATKLAQALNNLGLGFANPVLSNYIDQLSRLAGVADSELRPAMQTLIQQTKSYSKSQELLNLAIEVSRGSGVELATVSQDLAAAYVGNTKGLKKYNLGLSQAELKTMSFAEVQKKLNAQFKGSNAAYLKTYAGQLEVLKVAAGEAQETIGKGLMDSLSVLASDGTVQGLADSMQKFADFTSNAIYGIASLVSEMKNLKAAAPSWINKLIGLASNVGPNAQIKQAFKGLQTIANYGERKRNEKLMNPSVQMFMTDQANQRLNNELIKKQKEQQKQQDKLIKDQTKELKKQAQLKKQSALFDIEKIGIVAALQGKITAEERLRLETMQAILNGDDTLATQLSKKLADTIDSTGKLSDWLAKLPDAKNPFAGWDEWLKTFSANLARVTGGTPSMPISSGNVPQTPIASPDLVLAQASAGFQAANQQIKILVEGGDEVTSLMRFKIQEAAQSGSTTNWSQTVGAWDR